MIYVLSSVVFCVSLLNISKIDAENKKQCFGGTARLIEQNLQRL